LAGLLRPPYAATTNYVGECWYLGTTWPGKIPADHHHQVPIWEIWERGMWVDCGQNGLLTLSEPETDRAVHKDLPQLRFDLLKFCSHAFYSAE
jgi:hypothetical protein